MFSFLILSATALYFLLRSRCLADDPINVSGAGTSIVGGAPGWVNPYSPSACLFLTCSSPDVAFHAPPWRFACGPVPVALSRNRRKPKDKGLNLSGKSHCHSHLINRKSCLEMRRGEKGKKKKKIVLPTNDSKFGGILPSTVLLIYYEGIIVELSWPIWHKGERRGSIHYSHCNIFRAVRDMCLQ